MPGTGGTRGDIWQKEQNLIDTAMKELGVLGGPLDPTGCSLNISVGFYVNQVI